MNAIAGFFLLMIAAPKNRSKILSAGVRISCTEHCKPKCLISQTWYFHRLEELSRKINNDNHWTNRYESC